MGLAIPAWSGRSNMLCTMPSLAQWIRDLADAVRRQPPQVETHMRRVLVPGFQPLDAEGFVRFAAVKAIYRVGMPPEALSVLQWMSKRAGDEHKLDEFAMHMGAGLTLVCDRRVEVLSELPLRLEGSDQLTFITMSETADRRLVSPIRNADVGADFALLLGKLATLEGKAERAILVSIDLHYGAVLLFDRDLTAAYTLL